MNRPTAVIAEDEAPQREALRRRLAVVWPELRVVAEAGNGPEALAQVEERSPTVVFLDIRMPGMGGVEVARRIAGRCHLVFVTAYDEYAVAAFEAEAVDYLVKPVSDARLAQTCARLRRRLAEAAAPQPQEALLQRLAAGAPPAPGLRWIRAQKGGEVRLLPVERVALLLAEEKYTSVFAGGEEYLIRTPVKDLEAALDPERFWRVHRNALVNLTFVEGCRRDESGRQWLRVKGVAREVAVSRAYGHLFKPM